MFNSWMFNQGPFNGVPVVQSVQYLEMLYVFDSTEKLITTLPEDSFFNAVHREVLNGENTFQFTIPANSEHSEYVVEGNLVAFRDLDSYWQVFEIKRLVDVHGDGLTRTAYCEHIFYELLDDIVTDRRPSADATAALAGMLDGTRWQVGIVDDLGASSTSAYYESALSAVQKVANAWKGELNWRCVIEGGVITRYVDLLAMRGTDTGKQFAYSKDILSIEREVDTSGVVTALYGRGKGIELDSGGYGRRLTFADVEAPGKPLGQEWIGDTDALARWGRPGGRHRFDVFIDEEETDPVKLLEKTKAELDRRKVPRATYRLDVVSLEELTGYEHEKVRLGDLVRVIDREFKPELVVSARVIEIERDILDPANTKVVLGSFAPTIVEATINVERRVNDMANRPFNTKWLDGKINVLQNAIENTQSYVFQTGEDGILILDAPTYDQATKAMKLGGGIFAIANQKDGQGGWNWRTFGDGSGFTADLITAGMIDAGLVQIGPETTFAPGYDPSQIEGASAVGMGVDSDCLGLWHFDGSLNSHKGVAADSNADYNTGLFGQALNIATGKHLKVPAAGLSASQGTISFRAKNLAESGNGSVLVDLPKSDNTQGLRAGIANDGKVYLTDNTTAAYGPNKSTLTGWDSISLAWKPERLSLVVNDEEACYIENPGLPASLGSHVFIGTDRNGANAINTLIDELRIDKVYRDVNIRTGWHKMGIPFYTSEDMKQWPGYMKLETDGLKVYDSQDQLRVLLGSWLDSAVRKYGIKIVDGEIYSTLISTKKPGATGAYTEISPTGTITIYDILGKIGLMLSGLSGQGAVDWYFGGTKYAGAFINAGTDRDLIIWTLQSNSGISLSTYNGAAVEIGRGGGNSINLDASVVHVSDDLNVWQELFAGSLLVFDSKNCAEPTENYGIRLLNAVEAPELKYYDSGVIYLQNGEATVHLDPIFLECIEPDTELTPWQIWVECYGENGVYVSEVGADYFKVKERNGGTSNNKVIWRFEAIRKNYAGIRLREVTI